MQFLDFDDQLSSVKTLSKGADSVSKEISINFGFPTFTQNMDERIQTKAYVRSHQLTLYKHKYACSSSYNNACM